MGVRVETKHEVYVEIPDTLARSILERLLTLGEDIEDMEEGDVADITYYIVRDLNEYVS